MRTVYKYPVPLGVESFVLHMSVVAKVLCLQMQRGHPHIWAETDNEGGIHIRRFRVVTTGGQVTADCRHYVGTFQTHDGDLVFHVYEA